MITLLLLLGCPPPILLDTARTLDTGTDTADTAGDTDSGADTDTAIDTGTDTDTAVDTANPDPCHGAATCDAALPPDSGEVTPVDLSQGPEMQLTPTSPGHVDVILKHLGEGTGGTATARGIVTPADRRVDLTVELFPSGEKTNALNVSFEVSGLPAGDWTITDGRDPQVVTVQ